MTLARWLMMVVNELHNWGKSSNFARNNKIKASYVM